MNQSFWTNHWINDLFTYCCIPKCIGHTIHNQPQVCELLKHSQMLAYLLSTLSIFLAYQHSWNTPANQIQRLELAVIQLLQYNYYRERAVKSYAFITPHSCPQDQSTELSHQVSPILRGILETWISSFALSILTLASHMCTWFHTHSKSLCPSFFPHPSQAHYHFSFVLSFWL